MYLEDLSREDVISLGYKYLNGDEENGIVLAKAEVLNSVALKILGQIDQGKESEE